MFNDNKLSKEFEPEVICPNCSTPVNKIDFEIIGCPACKFKDTDKKDTPTWELEPMESSSTVDRGKETWFE